MALSRISRSNVLELMRVSARDYTFFYTNCTLESVYTDSVYLQMTLYVFFPVGVFYYFNAPGYFDHKVEKRRVSDSTTRLDLL